AFRRTAYDQVGGMAPGPGEDFDLTMQLRKAGWRVRFAPDAVCATDVPATFSGYVRQRRRWERDIVRLRYRRHANTLDPTNGKFNLRELFHQAEFLVFHVIASVVFPFYLIWLFSLYGLFAFVVLLAIQLGLFVVDLVAILASKVIGAGPKLLAPFVFLPGYTLFQSYIARFIRLFSYAEEWFFFSSEHDTYVPKRVRLERKW
ncbi:MAG: glycosyltransferase family 2 protein, partial [Pseudomonadota bacterium]